MFTVDTLPLYLKHVLIIDQLGLKLITITGREILAPADPPTTTNFLNPLRQSILLTLCLYLKHILIINYFLM